MPVRSRARDRIARFWEQPGLGARLALAAMALSVVSGIIGFIGGQLFAGPFAEPQKPDRLLMQGAIAIVLQVALVLGLRSARRGLRMIAVAAGFCGMFLVIVSLFIGAELVRGTAPIWVWPRVLLLVTSGLLYFAAAWRAALAGQPTGTTAS